MKKVIAFLVLFAVVTMVAFQACNKDKDDVDEPNQTPVANAGNDTTFLITNCEPAVGLRLDGRKSYDPGSTNSLVYVWKQLTGPNLVMDNIDRIKPIVYLDSLLGGEYTFELEVLDSKSLSSRDTIIVRIENIINLTNLDLDIATPFEYEEITQDYYGGKLDVVTIRGNVIIASEPFYYYFNETADQADINSWYDNNISLNNSSTPARYINGKCSVDFDSLYVKGGGAFEGTIKVLSASGYIGCENKTPDIPLITITGNLNAAAKTISMRIKGVVLF